MSPGTLGVSRLGPTRATCSRARGWPGGGGSGVRGPSGPAADALRARVGVRAARQRRSFAALAGVFVAVASLVGYSLGTGVGGGGGAGRRRRPAAAWGVVFVAVASLGGYSIGTGVGGGDGDGASVAAPPGQSEPDDVSSR